MPQKHYKNPPLELVSCEFLFTDDSHWDITMPGLLFEKIKGHFPIKEEIKKPLEEKSNEAEAVLFELQIRFSSKDKLTFVQMGNRYLSISRLKPYSTWENFEPFLLNTYEALTKTNKDFKISKMRLRYINRILLQNSISVPDYFNFRPFYGPKLPKGTFDFILGSRFYFDKNRDECRTMLTYFKDTDNLNNLNYILEITYMTEICKNIDTVSIIKWFTKAHLKIDNIFEGCITDKLGDTFNRG